MYTYVYSIYTYRGRFIHGRVSGSRITHERDVVNFTNRLSSRELGGEIRYPWAWDLSWQSQLAVTFVCRLPHIRETTSTFNTLQNKPKGSETFCVQRYEMRSAHRSPEPPERVPLPRIHRTPPEPPREFHCREKPGASRSPQSPRGRQRAPGTLQGNIEISFGRRLHIQTNHIS